MPTRAEGSATGDDATATAAVEEAWVVVVSCRERRANSNKVACTCARTQQDQRECILNRQAYAREYADVHIK